MKPNYHILVIKYLGPTDINGSRIKIVSERFKASKTIHYDHECNSAREGAEKWLTNHGFNIIGHGEGKDHDYVITDSFFSPKDTFEISQAVKKQLQNA